MINPIMKNHSSLYENNRQTNKSVITHQNNDMTVYCKHKNLTYPLTPPPLPPHPILLQNDLMVHISRTSFLLPSVTSKRICFSLVEHFTDQK